MPKLSRLLIVAVAVSAIAVPIAWLGVQQSDAYRVAAEYVGQNPQVVANIGEVQRTSLSILGYSLRASTIDGDAKFKLKLIGTRSRATARVELVKRGDWRPTHAQLMLEDGSLIELSP